MQRCVDVEAQTGRGRSWCYKMADRFKRDRHSILPAPIPGRPPILQKLPNMKKTIERNLKKKNRKNNKSTRKLETHFKDSSGSNDGIIALDQ
jgi:hypothetical protein